LSVCKRRLIVCNRALQTDIRRSTTDMHQLL
jgi:hypothetical protein